MLITDHDDGGRCKKRVGHDHGADNNEDDDADDNSDDNDADADDADDDKARLRWEGRQTSWSRQTGITLCCTIQHIHHTYV